MYLADELENREYAGYKRGLEQGIDQGIEQGEHKKALDTARRMLSEKCGADLIHQ